MIESILSILVSIWPHVTVVWMWPIESYALSQKRWAADDSVPNSHLSDSWFIATSKSNYFSKKIELWQFEDDSTVDCLGHTKWPESGWFHLISHLLHNRCILQDYFWDVCIRIYYVDILYYIYIDIIWYYMILYDIMYIYILLLLCMYIILYYYIILYAYIAVYIQYTGYNGRVWPAAGRL